MSFDIERAVQHAKQFAKPQSIHKCAKFTREAIAAGGISLAQTLKAKDYGTSLQQAGFHTVSTTRKGDVVVIQGYPGNDYGHMAIYDGQNWISDFVQSALYPGPGYRTHKPAYKIYRYCTTQSCGEGHG